MSTYRSRPKNSIKSKKQKINNVNNSIEEQVYKTSSEAIKNLIELSNQKGVNLNGIKITDLNSVENIKKIFLDNLSNEEEQKQEEEFSEIVRYNKYTQPEEEEEYTFPFDVEENQSESIKTAIQKSGELLEDIQSLIDKIDNDIKEEKQKNKENGVEDIFAELDEIFGITIEDSKKKFKKTTEIKEKIKNYKYDSIKFIKIKN